MTIQSGNGRADRPVMQLLDQPPAHWSSGQTTLGDIPSNGFSQEDKLIARESIRLSVLAVNAWPQSSV